MQVWISHSKALENDARELWCWRDFGNDIGDIFSRLDKLEENDCAQNFELGALETKIAALESASTEHVRLASAQLGD
eukprot:42177-Karenia_brevis.AAC.1